VRPSRSQKIDHEKEYPCPCRKRGHLKPIFLTEAFGCDRCQHIFVIQENGQIIERVSSNYSSKKTWRWTGYGWTTADKGMRESLPIILGIFLLVLIVVLGLFSIIPRPVLAICLVSVIFFIVWVAYR
jgi:Flp pilus assembly protein TadB